MSEDEFGGVAVETPTADEFGGVPVTAVADEFGGVPVEPMGQWPDGPTASQQIKRQLRSVAESPIRFERGLGEKIGNVAQGAARTADMVTSGDAARAPVQAVDDFLVAHRARTRGELKVSRPWGQARTPSAAYLERRRQQDEAATLARQQRLETDSPLHKWGTEQVKFSKQVFGGSPDIDDTFISQLVVSAGGMLPDIAMSAVPVVGPAAAATSYGLQAGELQAQEAVATGRPETADKAFVAAAGLGFASERLLSVSPRFWKLAKESRLAGIAPQKFGDAWAKWAAKAPVKARILEGGLREGVQEGSEQAGQNYIASDVAGYDPERPVMKDVPKAAALGAVLGGVVGGASYLVHRQPAKTDGGASVPASRPVDDELPPAPDLSNVRIQTGTDDLGNPIFAAKVETSNVQRPTSNVQRAPETLDTRLETQDSLAPAVPIETERQRMARESVEAMRALAAAKAAANNPPLSPAATTTPAQTTATPQREANTEPAASNSAAGESSSADQGTGTTPGQEMSSTTTPPVVVQTAPVPPSVPQSAIGNRQSAIPVTESHLAQAREAVADLSGEERPPDILDELEGQVTSGPVKFAPDMEDTINASRERVAEVLHKKPWKRLSSAQRKAINRELRASTTEGLAADEALGGLGEKYAELNADDFANALLDAGEARLLERRKEDSKEVLQMAQEIAEAEAGNLSTLNSPPSTDEVTDWDQAAASTTAEAVDPIEAALARAIAASDPWQQQRRGEMHLFGLPKFMTRLAYNGLLRIIRATYRGTKNLAQAIQAGIEWLRAQNLPDFSETDIRAWLAANVTVTPGDDDINIREFSDQLEADQPLPPDPARMVANLLYDRRTNESDAAFAARIMQAVGGPAAAEQVFTDSTNGLPGSARMFLGQLILKAYGVAGQHEAAAIFYDNTFAAHITDVAQALQSLNAFLALTPEGKLIWAQKKIKRAGDDLVAPVQPQLDAAKKELDAANQSGIEATTASPDVQTAAREAVDAALEKQALTPGSELAEAIRKEVLDTLVAAGLITEREAEIFRLHLEGTADNSTLAQKLERAGIPLHDKRADAINQLYKAKTKTEREKIKSRARKARADQTSKAAAKGDEHAIDLAIKRAMKELRVMLGTVIREHHTKAEAVGKSLAEKIAAASGLNEADAKKLADAVLKRFEALVTARKQKALEKLLKPVLRLARPQLVQRIVERSNQGALSQEQFWNAVRAQLHLPAWSPELAERIRKQVDVLERIPADQTERKQKAHTDLLNIIERAKGIDFLDLGISFYKTNLLTGITTTIKNVASTAQNVMLELPVQLLTHPQHAADLLIMAGEIIKAGSVSGVQGAWDNWQTGILTGSRVDKVQAGRTLEQARFGQRGGVPLNGGMMARGMRAVLESDPGLPYLKMWKPVTLTGTALKNLAEMRVIRFLNAWKFVTRGLGSQDMLFFKPAEEARAAILALRMARTEGLHGEAARDRARQVLGYGAKAVATARAQAEAEGFTGAAAARRTAEILTQNRPLELREDARNFALRATFNAEPYGLFGFLTHILNQGKTHPDGKIRLASNVLFPFTDIIANVLNAQLNYTPVGALRAAFARKSLLGHKLETLTLEQQAEFKRELYVKALLGTTLLAALGLKLASHLDDPDPELALYGAGPENPDDRKGLEAKKWIPHSLKVGDKYYSYGTTPLAIPLAWLGNYQDRVRDARVFKTRSAQRVAQDTSLMAAGAVVNGALVITEQSFLTGMMQVNDILAAKGSEQQAQAFIKLGFRSATSGVIPNAVRQVDRYFDPNVYEQRNTAAILVNNVPFLRGEKGQPSLNALGLPLQRPLASQFASSEATVPPLVAYLAETGNWPSPPNRNEIYPRTGRTMTEAEYYDFVKGSGALAYERLEKLRAEGTLAGYKDDATRAKVISAYFESARKQWRSQHGW